MVGEEFMKSVKHEGCGIMVWGYINSTGVCFLRKCQRDQGLSGMPTLTCFMIPNVIYCDRSDSLLGGGQAPSTKILVYRGANGPPGPLLPTPIHT